MECQPFPSDDASTASPAFLAGLADQGKLLDELPATVTRLEEDLIAAHRLAMLGTMSAMVVHEVNNLMTPIESRADFALCSGDAADMRNALERTLVHVRRAKAVMRHLLDLVKPDECPVESCSVASAVREAIDMLPRSLEKDGIELRISVPDDLHVTAQPGLLEQVLLNLVLNARHAMHGSRGKLKISAQREAESVVIDVRDRGTGIAPERIDNAVNAFLASRENGQPCAWQSVGLGLNVCRVIAGKHGATIEAMANDDQGCTFRLRWPGGSRVKSSGFRVQS